MRMVGGVVGGIVGAYFGGPYGAQIGFAVGSMLGGALEGGPDDIENKGPRLEDLTGPTSNIIGNQINIVYGTDRVSGSIIWTSNLKETKHKTKSSSGGKGIGSDQTVVNKTFTYSVSFAVAICEGPIVNIRKIWMNKAIKYDLDSDAISQNLNFALYTGTEDQTPDPTMEAYIGVGKVSAHRGLAYVVFKDLQLEDYGNRVPMTIEFEVVTEGVINAKADSFYSTPINYGAATSGTSTSSEARFIFQSPITGKLIASTYSTDSSQGAYAIAFNTTGIYLHSYYINTESPEGVDYNLEGHYPLAGILVKNNTEYYIMNARYVDGAARKYSTIVYDINGNLITNQLNGGLYSGSFYNHINNPILYYDECMVLSNNELSYETIVVWVDVEEILNADGTISSSVVEKIHSNSTQWTIDNTDFINSRVYTYDFITYVQTAYRMYENDNTNLQMRPISSISGVGGKLGICSWTIDKVPGITLGTCTTTFNLSIAEIPIDVSLMEGDTIIGEISLENGDMYAFYHGYLTGDVGNYRIFTYYKPNGDTDYTFINVYPKQGEGTVGNLYTCRPCLDSNTGEVVILDEDHDTLEVFNIFDHSWSSEVLSGFTADLPATSKGHTLYKNTSSPYYFIASSNAPIKYWRILRNSTDKTATTLGAITKDLCIRASIEESNIDVSDINSLPIKGYSIRTRAAAKNNILAILPTYLVDPVESEWNIKFKQFGTSVIDIDNNDLGANTNKDGSPIYEIENKEEEEIPRAIALQYSGFTNNYLKSQQSATRNGFIYNDDQSLVKQLPVVLEDDFASKLAEKMLYILWVSATIFNIKLPKKYSYLEPTDIIRFYMNNENEEFIGKITKIDEDVYGYMEITGERYDSENLVSYATGQLDQGENTQVIPIVAYMYVQPIDFRPLYEVEEQENITTSIYLAGGGYSADWLAGEVFYSIDGTEFNSLLYITEPSTFGIVTNNVNDPLTIAVMDNKHNINITVTSGVNNIQSITDDQLIQGLNTVIITDPNTNKVIEIFQFKTATQVNSVSYTLTGLLRKRYSTYGSGYRAISKGDIFILASAETIYQTNVSSKHTNTKIQLKGASIGQSIQDVFPRSYTFTAEWSKNPKPIDFTATEITDGDIQLDWKSVQRLVPNNLLGISDNNQTIEQFKIEVYDIDDILVSTIIDIQAETYTYDITGNFLQGDYMLFKIYQYSDIHGYDTEYEEIAISTAANSRIYDIATPTIHYDFSEAYNAKKSNLANPGVRDLNISSTFPTIIPYKGDDMLYSGKGSCRIVDYGKYETIDNPNGQDLTTTHILWIRIINKPDSDTVIYTFSGPGFYDVVSLKLKTDLSLNWQFTGSSSISTPVLIPGKLYCVAIRANSDNHTIYLNGINVASDADNAFKSDAQGYLIFGPSVSCNTIFEVGQIMMWSSVLSADNLTRIYKYSGAHV